MLSQAASRVQARQARLDLQVVVAGVAASMCKEGNRLVKRLERALSKASAP